jgi:hypothetical protein
VNHTPVLLATFISILETDGSIWCRWATTSACSFRREHAGSSGLLPCMRTYDDERSEGTYAACRSPHLAAAPRLGQVLGLAQLLGWLAPNRRSLDANLACGTYRAQGVLPKSSCLTMAQLTGSRGSDGTAR